MPHDPRQLRSQRLRQVNFQGDALRLGMNWTEEDLGKPQVLVDSAVWHGPSGHVPLPAADRGSQQRRVRGGRQAGRLHRQRHLRRRRPGARRDELLARLARHHGGDDRDPRARPSARRHGADLGQRQVGAGASDGDRPLQPAGDPPAGRHAAQRAGLRHLRPDVGARRGGRARRDCRARNWSARSSMACPTCGACQFMGSASTGQVFVGGARPGAAGLGADPGAAQPAPALRARRPASRS